MRSSFPIPLGRQKSGFESDKAKIAIPQVGFGVETLRKKKKSAKGVHATVQRPESASFFSKVGSQRQGSYKCLPGTQNIGSMSEKSHFKDYYLLNEPLRA